MIKTSVATMIQLKHIFGLPATLCHSVRLKSPSINRSAGNNRSAHTRTSDTVVSSADADNSREPRISGKSYAKLIADYNNAIEHKKSLSKLNHDPNNRGVKSGFFGKSPFERLARVSSLVKIKNVGNSSSPSLSTRSVSSPPVIPTKTWMDSASEKGHLDETDVLGQVTERADWLDHVVEAHKAKQENKDNLRANHSLAEKNLAHPLVQRVARTFVKKNCKQLGNVNDHRGSYVKKKSGDSRDYVESVSVTVKPLQTSNNVKNDFRSMSKKPDKNTMIVTIAEETKSTSKSLPLRHIDVTINDVPVTDIDTIVSKVEKLDIVSSAEKIEIKIPVRQGSKENLNRNRRSANPTINLCISDQVNDRGQNFDHHGMTRQTEGSGSEISHFTSEQPSSFFIAKIHSVQTIEASAQRSKAVPWWTTEESFRRSETDSAPSNYLQTSEKTGQSSSGIEEVGALVTNRKFYRRNETGAEIRDPEMRSKKSMAEPSSSGHFPKTRRKIIGVLKTIENESCKKSSQVRQLDENVPLRAKKEAVAIRHEASVKSIASNEAKKEPSVVVDGTVVIKNSGTIAPQTDDTSKTKPNVNGSRENIEALRGKSMTDLARSTKENANGSCNLSSPKNVENVSKPITPINVKNNFKLNSEQLQQDIALKSKASNSLSRNIRPSTTMQSSPSSIISSLDRCTSTKPKDKSICARGVNIPKKIAMKPIEKKKNGTLIDRGLTVSTRKKLERKLSDSQGTSGDKKISKNDAPAVVATIKEVIPRRNKDPRGHYIDRGPIEKGRETSEVRSKTISNEQKTLLINCAGVKNDKYLKQTSFSKCSGTASSDKKLLYSAWLRRRREQDDQDPNSKKPGDSCDS